MKTTVTSVRKEVRRPHQTDFERQEAAEAFARATRRLLGGGEYGVTGRRRHLREIFDSYAKFRVFALVSVLLVPNASKLLRRFLRHQEFREKQLRKDEPLERQIELREQGEIRFEEILDRFCEDARELWWFPNATAENIPTKGGLGRPPHWHGEERPKGARQVQIKTRFPSIGFLTYLVRDLGYDGRAAFATMVRGHQPWTYLPDRRRANPVDADTQARAEFEVREHLPIVSPVPYCPAPPKTEDDFTWRQVQDGLQKMRIDKTTKAALMEVVYRRRSTVEVSAESGVPADKLYVYVSRLRKKYFLMFSITYGRKC